MDPIKKFSTMRKKYIDELGKDARLKKQGLDFLINSAKRNYSYVFDWLGLPIIQYPQDIIAMQEIVWRTRPDLIIETGIARGGSLIFYASLLQLVGKGTVVGIDVDIRAHNRKQIESHPLAERIRMIEGSSTDPRIIRQVTELAKRENKVLVCLDSLHTHDHVSKELELYSPLVSVGSYLVVFDTVVEDMPRNAFSDRPWSKGNNPKTAVQKFLQTHKNFKVDTDIENKLIITVAPGGYLKRVK